MADNEEIKGSADDRPVVEVDEGIEALRKQLKDSEDRRLAAEARENKLKQDLHAKDGEVHQTNQQIVESAIEKLKTEKSMAKQAYRDARQSGDIDAETDAQEAMSDISAKLLQLETGLTAMKAAPQQQAPAKPKSGDPVEDLARGMEADGHASSAAWIRKHPEFARDPKKYAAMIGAHNVAVNGKGLTPGTADYFADVEKTLGVDPAQRHEEHRDDPTPNGADHTSGAAKAVRTREADTPPAAAPPSRGGGGGAVRLTAAQKEAASISGISEEEYAKNLQKGKN